MQDNVLQEIKDRLNIADVLSGYIQVKKSGANYKAPCPFHNEKSPSLMISPQKQIWHCFGCGEGGDVFGFVMKYENLDFKDTLKILADKAGVQLPSYSPTNKVEEDEKEILYKINNFASRYYHQVLMSKTGAVALEYLKNRGLSEQTIVKWQIGFAPEDFHALERALMQKGIKPEQMVKAGVSSRNERGQMYDRFRGRITFPIYNYFGETVGFSARILNDDGKSAKYVNSPETIIYNKSKILFGLNFAKDTIRKKDEAVLVEGQMDCISAHQAGFANTIAVSGTALNEYGFAQLARLTKNLKFCFDADVAGQTATRRSGELALKNNFKLKLIILKAVKDPDELIKKSPGLWEKAVSEAVWFLDYYINKTEVDFPGGSVEQKLYLSKEVLPFLHFIQDPLEQDHYINKMVSKFEISDKVIRDQIKKAGQPISQSAGKPVSKPAATNPNSGSLLLQKEVLGGLLCLEEFAESVRMQVETSDYEEPAIAELVEVWLNNSNNGAILKNSTLAKEAVFMVESQLEDLNGDRQKLKKSLDKSFILLKLHSLKTQQKLLQSAIKQAETTGDKEKLSELNKKFASIISLRMSLEKSI